MVVYLLLSFRSKRWDSLLRNKNKTWSHVKTWARTVRILDASSLGLPSFTSPKLFRAAELIQAPISIAAKRSLKGEKCLFRSNCLQNTVFLRIIAAPRLIASNWPPSMEMFKIIASPDASRHLLFLLSPYVKLKLNLIQQNWSVMIQALKINQGTKFGTF